MMNTLITLGETVKRLRSNQTIPEKTAVLTVDDGYKSEEIFERELGYKPDLYCYPYGLIEKFKTKARMHALPVVKESPVNPEIKDTNPPRLTPHIHTGKIHADNIQCFVNGRRTLYTITAPSRSGSQWHWYTHLWVNTQQGE